MRALERERLLVRVCVCVCVCTSLNERAGLSLQQPVIVFADAGEASK